MSSHRDTHSKYITVLLLHPGKEAGSISPKLQSMAQPGDAAQVQRRLTRSPAEATSLSITGQSKGGNREKPWGSQRRLTAGSGGDQWLQRGAFQREGAARAKVLGLVSWAQRTMWQWVGMGQQSTDNHGQSQVVGETLWSCRQEGCGFVSE